MQRTAIRTPELMLPEAETALLRDVYARAGVILEYGAGGSTVLAASLPGTAVTSVESDPDWAAMMRAWFDANPPATGSGARIVWADIGPTRDWGHPKTDEAWSNYARYPLGIWSEKTFVQPDAVLVDGRFRIGCALATAFLTARPVTLLFDDYATRAHYHKIEEVIGAPAEIVGRMARFEIAPQPVPASRLLQIIQFMQRP